MLTKRFLVMVLALLWIGAVAGCEKKSAEGPAERAGKEIDKTVGQMGDKVKEAGKEVDKALDQIGDKINEATKK